MHKKEFDDATEAKLSALSKTEKVLVTGGCGYLGTVIIEMLLERGFEVTVVDNLAYSQNPLFHLFHTGRLNFIFGDVTNDKLMAEIMAKGDYGFIFPLAAVVGFPISEQKPEITWMINRDAILTLLKNRKPHQKIIFPTTNSGYGTTTGETYCTEETPLEPISTYGKSKAAAEKAIFESGNSVCFRLATLFGFSQRMRTDLMVNDFVLQAAREKVIVLFERKFKRNFLHVRDASRAFLFAMANWEKMKGNIYNLGHPDCNISKEEMCNHIKKQIPDLNIFHAEIGVDPDKRNYVVSNDKVVKAGFTFNYTLDDGIRELISGYKAFHDFRFKNY